MIQEELENLPLSKYSFVNGSRRQAREKVMQILYCSEICELPLEDIFKHIFFRSFNFGDSLKVPDKLLSPEEIYELEADIPIIWDDEEVQFAKDLIKIIFDNKESVTALIDKFTEHWEMERIANIDRILMSIAVTEILYFEEIPTIVSINEAIEIAKKYSTHKSGAFINGILDQIHLKLKADDKIKKSGRGLQEE